MKILFITPSYKPAYIYGGPTVSISELAEALVNAGHSVTIYTTTANGKEELDVQAGKPVLLNGVTVFYFKRQTGDHTHFSLGLWGKLFVSAKKFDVVHLQSWWSLLIIIAAAICKVKRCTYFISPRGMLSTYSFKKQHSSIKKLIHKFLGNALLKHSYLHATTLLEWDDCLLVNKNWKGFILPNLVTFPKFAAETHSVKKKNEAVVFGFLSRIDEKKGLELLMTALSKVEFAYLLKIAGKGEDRYISSLQNLAFNLGIASKIEWCGWKSNQEKFVFLRSIDVFVLTSYNENFANTVIESLIVGTPVLLSKGVGLADYVEDTGLGWICETNVPSITGSLNQVFKEQHKIEKIKGLSQSLIRKDFDREALAKQYSKAYEQFL